MAMIEGMVVVVWWGWLRGVAEGDGGGVVGWLRGWLRVMVVVDWR